MLPLTKNNRTGIRTNSPVEYGDLAGVLVNRVGRLFHDVETKKRRVVGREATPDSIAGTCEPPTLGDKITQAKTLQIVSGAWHRWLSLNGALCPVKQGFGAVAPPPRSSPHRPAALLVRNAMIPLE
ncbi:hypothetical protein J6590_034744 [Homalodisca vitripennis]|nr:hypothetical protein J6590_034744 [Homalodisca vitripennis]